MSQGLSSVTAVRPFVLILIVLGWCRAGFAQEPQLPLNQQGRRTAPILLLSRPEIQKELELSPNVIAQARTRAIALQRKAAELHGKTGDGILMARRAIDHEQTEWLNKNLSPTQIDRLHQLDLQWEGPGAFLSRPIVAEYLGLTPQQLKPIAQIIADRNQRRGTTTSTPIESEESFQRRVLAGLSDQQRNQWTALLGEPFRFQGDLPARDARVAPVGANSTP